MIAGLASFGLIAWISPQAVWTWTPVEAGLFIFGIMWGVVSLLALLQGTLSLKNPAFIFGDPALALAVGMSQVATQQLNKTSWANSDWFLWAAMIGGALVGFGLFEYYWTWRDSNFEAVRWADWWHHGLYPFMWYWVAYAFFGSWTFAFNRGERWWIPILCTSLILIWAAAGMLQNKWREEGRLHKRYGFTDLLQKLQEIH